MKNELKEEIEESQNLSRSQEEKRKTIYKKYQFILLELMVIFTNIKKTN